MNITDPKTIAIAIVIAAAAYYFLVVKRQPAVGIEKSQDEIDLESLQSNSAARTKLIGEATTATKMSGEDEDYNRKRIEYTELTGEEAPRSWTYDMLQDKINSYKKTQAALQEYVRISGDTDRSDEVGWTAARYETEIKNAEEKKRQQLETENNAKRTAWKTSVQNINKLLQDFILNLDNRGLRKHKNGLMANFKQIEAMNDAEFVYFMKAAIDAYNERKIDLIKSVFEKIIANPLIYFKENKASCEAIKNRISRLENVWNKTINEYGEFV